MDNDDRKITPSSIPPLSEDISTFKRFLVKYGSVDVQNLFERIRIKDGHLDRSKEINLVLLTGPGIYCFEVVSLDGHIRAHEDRKYWEQKKCCGKKVMHLNPCETIHRKGILLKNRFEESGITLRDGKIFFKVIMMNTVTTLDRNILENECVVPQNQLLNFASSFRPSFSSYMPSLFTGQLSYSRISNIRRELSQLPTIDILVKRDGSWLEGEYKDGVGMDINRSKIGKICFGDDQNKIWSLLCGSHDVKKIRADLHSRKCLQVGKIEVIAAIIRAETELVEFNMIDDDFCTSEIEIGEIQYIKLSC